MSTLLSSKLSSVRRKLTLVSSLRGLAAIVGAAVLLLTAGILLDFAFELPRWVRAAFLAIDLTVITYILLMHVFAPLIWGPDDDEIALMVERSNPDFATRLIASVQFTRPGAIPAGASPSIVRAMIAQTELLAEPMDFAAVVRTDPAIKTAAVSALILLLGLAAFVYGNTGGEHVSTDLLARAFLDDRPVPRKTRIKVIDGNKILPIGDGLTLEAFATGVIPDKGEVDISYKSGRKSTFSIEPLQDEQHPAPADGSRRFARMIDNIQEDFQYRFRLNDNHTSWFSVTAVPRPTVTGVDFSVIYPRYTARAPEHKSPGDLTILAGSELKIRLTASKPVKPGALIDDQVHSSAVRLVGLNRQLPLIHPKEAKSSAELEATIPIPARGLTGLSFYLEDKYGIGSKNETIFPVEIVPDKDPTIRIHEPDRKEELAVTQAKVKLKFEAADDYGLAKVILWHKPESSDQPPSSIDLDLSGISPQELRHLWREYLFDLAPLHLPEQSIEEYWIEVRDGNNVTGPGRAFSEHYKVKIVSEIEKRADLMNRLNDQLNTVQYVTEDQEKLNQKLGQLIVIHEK